MVSKPPLRITLLVKNEEKSGKFRISGVWVPNNPLCISLLVKNEKKSGKFRISGVWVPNTPLYTTLLVKNEEKSIKFWISGLWVPHNRLCTSLQVQPILSKYKIALPKDMWLTSTRFKTLMVCPNMTEFLTSTIFQRRSAFNH